MVAMTMITKAIRDDDYDEDVDDETYFAGLMARMARGEVLDVD